MPVVAIVERNGEVRAKPVERVTAATVKAALFDGWACIGSANFNKLSLRRNLETNIATSDARFVSELRQRLFEHDFAVSTELTRPVEVSSSDRFAEWLLDQF